MDHRQELETLVELARAGNMRRTAEILGVSQSTLSECVARLEDRYGAPLFVRDRRGSRPTVYGEVVVAAAAQALRVLGEAEREIGLIKGSASGRLAIGAEPGVIEPFLTTAIVRGMARYPQLRYRLRALDSGTLARELTERRIEFFLGVRPDAPLGGIELSELGAVAALPFVRRGHPLAGADVVGLGAILRFPIVQGPGARWFVRRIADAIRADSPADAPPQATVVVNDFGVVRALVRQTDAVGFAVDAMLGGDSEREVFVPLAVPPEQQALLRFPLVIGRLAERSLPPAAEALVEEIRGVVAGYCAGAPVG
ncbi:MAG: LysR family transcriptional regulator [Gammaproteobacteria bacterium]|nr:LysR family transcriptional regulator [Gammaproteobacteria bacterium]